MQDEDYMARALKLRNEDVYHASNPNVGCVIVKDGEIVVKVTTNVRVNHMPK